MTNIEALELLKLGEKVKMNGDRTRMFYQAYSHDHIYQLTQDTPCSARTVAVYSPEEFLQTGNIDFVLVDDDDCCKSV